MKKKNKNHLVLIIIFYNTIVLEVNLIKKKKNNKNKIYKSTSKLDENHKKKIKLIKQQEKEIENNVGPGSYFTENFINKYQIKQNFKPFNQGEEKFEKINKSVNDYLGPGSYYLERENDWNKKSFNYLYI